MKHEPLRLIKKAAWPFQKVERQEMPLEPKEDAAGAQLKKGIQSKSTLTCRHCSPALELETFERHIWSDAVVKAGQTVGENISITTQHREDIPQPAELHKLERHSQQNAHCGFGLCGPDCAPVSVSDVGVDNDQDINDINRDLDLFEGDILMNMQRTAILGNSYRWESPVPYTFDSAVELNAKGVILKALEEFRLKTCMDFKLRDNETNYVSIEKDAGCFSYVGNKMIGGQILSIGQGCDTVGIVEHEFLHALGFWHEQSRYDRDDYVTILLENIERSNGNGPTIITKLPQYQNVIGQSFDMSHYDVMEFNNLYNCTSALAFLDRCSFENGSMCEMVRCSKSKASWDSVTSVPEGPHSGHSNLGVSGGSLNTSSPTSNASVPINATSAPDSSTPAADTESDFFMHFSTATADEGDRAKMDTRRMTPRRECSVQCLQFFYYHSGNESDQLNIWIREFDDEFDQTGTRQLVGQITGPPADYWQLQHVPVNATKMFQVEFEGQKGDGNSSGGFSVDDINLSETECPHHTWQIRDVERLSDAYSTLYSPRYYSPGGYAYQMVAYLRPNDIGVFVRLVSGDNDDQLQWPCLWRQVTIAMLDQNPDIQQRMSRQLSYTTDPNSTYSYVWDDPRIAGDLFNDSYGESYFVNIGLGYRTFITMEAMRNRGFIKGGDIFFLVSMQDISELRFNDSLMCNTMLPQQNFTLFSADPEDEGPCVPPPTQAPTSNSPSSVVSTPVLILLMVLALKWSP
ncbi:hypothetical protein AGOR_G00212520 [Albula goreensis]|uniref:Metalloendopeptidase n=1 Tax=Albula goreensis TaxID=1534307 RepID=A0A8T3CSQ3_9TELE|nr:hypothetical protein AGOR_G00212520 [Albula goreensis]